MNDKRHSILTPWIGIELNILLQLKGYNCIVCHILKHSSFLVSLDFPLLHSCRLLLMMMMRVMPETPSWLELQNAIKIIRY